MKTVLTGTIRSLAGIAGISALNSAMDGKKYQCSRRGKTQLEHYVV